MEVSLWPLSFSHSLDNQLIMLECVNITVVVHVLGQPQGQTVALELDTEMSWVQPAHPLFQVVSLSFDIHVWFRLFQSHDAALTHLWELCLCWYNYKYHPQTRTEPKGAFRWIFSWSQIMAYDLMSLIGKESNCLGEHGMAWVTNESMVCPTK